MESFSLNQKYVKVGYECKGFNPKFFYVTPLSKNSPTLSMKVMQFIIILMDSKKKKLVGKYFKRGICGLN